MDALQSHKESVSTPLIYLREREWQSEIDNEREKNHLRQTIREEEILNFPYLGPEKAKHHHVSTAMYDCWYDVHTLECC